MKGRERRAKTDPAAGMSRQRSTAWPARLADDVSVAKAVLSGRRAPRELGHVLARLSDSTEWRLADQVLSALGDDRARRDPGLALARSRVAERNDPNDEAGEWLALAQSLVDARTPALAARILFRLVVWYLRRAEITATRTLLPWGRDLLGATAEASADLLHAQALVADAEGERQRAAELYRRAIGRSATALTPLSRVVALHDLAETLSHREPRESVSLYGLALALIDANELDRGVRAAVQNGMGYALLCTGDIAQAKTRLQRAKITAREAGRTRIELFASFNESIAQELEGASDEAARSLDDLATRAHGAAPELVVWIHLRRLWLQLESGARSDVMTALRSTRLGQVRDPYADTVRTLHALALADGGSREALEPIAALVSSYRHHGDELTAFVLELWLAWVQHATGRTVAARRTVRRACAVGMRFGFVVSPNWWSSRLIELAAAVASPEQAAYVATLLRGPTDGRPEHTVVVSGDAVVVNGVELDPEAWRRGKTGTGVLHRLFAALVAAHPASLARDELADLLWPDSDGDKAIRNLYWATRDLRDALAGVDGIAIEVETHRYRLTTGTNVVVR